MSIIKKLKYILAYINNIHSNHANVHYNITQAKILLTNAIKKKQNTLSIRNDHVAL